MQPCECKPSASASRLCHPRNGADTRLMPHCNMKTAAVSMLRWRKVKRACCAWLTMVRLANTGAQLMSCKKKTLRSHRSWQGEVVAAHSKGGSSCPNDGLGRHVLGCIGYASAPPLQAAQNRWIQWPGVSSRTTHANQYCMTAGAFCRTKRTQSNAQYLPTHDSIHGACKMHTHIQASSSFVLA